MKDKNTKKKKFKLNPKTMGINYNKNEYQEIVLSNSNKPEDSFKK